MISNEIEIENMITKKETMIIGKKITRTSKAEEVEERTIITIRTEIMNKKTKTEIIDDSSSNIDIQLIIKTILTNLSRNITAAIIYFLLIALSIFKQNIIFID